MSRRKELRHREERAEMQPHRARFSRMGWALLAYLLAGSAVQLAVSAVTYPFAPWLLAEPVFQWAVMVCASYGIAFPVFAWVLRKIPMGVPELHAPLKPLHWVEAYIISLGAVYAGNFVTNMIAQWLQRLTGLAMSDPVEQILAYSTPLNLILTCVLAPVFEELMFRRMLLERLRPYGDRFAILASAVAFGLLHGNLSQMLYAFTTGVVFGYVALHTGCLWQTILLHAMVNVISSGLIPLLNELGTLGVAILSAIVLGSILLGGVLLLLRRRELWSAEGGLSIEERDKWKLFFCNPGMLAFGLLVVVLCIWNW